ncbi:hypothetical protein ACOME3_001671 [Neoechinorhynchus agilis]
MAFTKIPIKMDIYAIKFQCENEPDSRFLLADRPSNQWDTKPWIQLVKSLSKFVSSQTDYDIFYIDEQDEEYRVDTADEFNWLIEHKDYFAKSMFLKFAVRESKLSKSVKVKKVQIPINDHGRVSCDECDENIKGCRFKCLDCANFNLCLKCHSKGCHSHHQMNASWNRLISSNTLIRPSK